MRRFMGPTIGAVLAGLLVGSLLPSGPSPSRPPIPYVLTAQIIEINPKPPIEQNPTPPTEQSPKPPIERNPKPPSEKQSMLSGVILSPCLPSGSCPRRVADVRNGGIG